MKRRVLLGAFAVVAFVLGCAVLVVAVPADAGPHTVPPSEVKVMAVPAPEKMVSKAIFNINPVEDCGDSVTRPYICELGAYQAWFAFDVSGIPPGETIDSIDFTALLENLDPSTVERSIWYSADDSWVGGACPGNTAGDVLVGTLMHAGSTVSWETFSINMAAHDFNSDLADGMITLMVTGPTDGTHMCGYIDLTETGNLPYIVVNTALAGVEVPTAGYVGLLLLVVLLSAAGFILLRR
jgi:hypothetical protein